MTSITKRDIEIEIDKERALYFPFYELLVISDIHLGKSAHFRKEGIQIPKTVSDTDISRLTSLIDKYQPKTLLVTGDMFHHDINLDIDDFKQWRNTNVNLEIILVKGNHDRLGNSIYQQLNIKLHDKCYEVGDFCFTHKKEDGSKNGKYIVSGHIHPGVLLKGRAKQYLKFPCFFFQENHALLPAFSLFTGLFLVQPDKTDDVFVITPNKVMSV